MSAGRQNTSEKKNWNTPPKYVRVIKEFFDGVPQLDPCSNEGSMVGAETEYILPTNGLNESWDYDTIFVNPPYGRNAENKTTIKNWLQYGLDAHVRGAEILYLIPVATNTSHFKDIIFEHATAICFLKDTRLKFWDGGLEMQKGAPMACCFVYFGKRTEKFFDCFGVWGKCFKI